MSIINEHLQQLRRRHVEYIRVIEDIVGVYIRGRYPIEMDVLGS